jgi:hypothetical protein
MSKSKSVEHTSAAPTGCSLTKLATEAAIGTELAKAAGISKAPAAGLEVEYGGSTTNSAANVDGPAELVEFAVLASPLARWWRPDCRC